MSKEKYKNGVQLENKEEVKAKQPDPISFDAYFRMLMARNPRIMAHHAAPMRKYAEQSGLGESASLEQFEQAFKSY